MPPATRRIGSGTGSHLPSAATAATASSKPSVISIRPMGPMVAQRHRVPKSFPKSRTGDERARSESAAGLRQEFDLLRGRFAAEYRVAMRVAAEAANDCGVTLGPLQRIAQACLVTKTR